MFFLQVSHNESGHRELLFAANLIELKAEGNNLFVTAYIIKLNYNLLLQHKTLLESLGM